MGMTNVVIRPPIFMGQQKGVQMSTSEIKACIYARLTKTNISLSESYDTWRFRMNEQSCICWTYSENKNSACVYAYLSTRDIEYLIRNFNVTRNTVAQAFKEVVFFTVCSKDSHYEIPKRAGTAYLCNQMKYAKLVTVDDFNVISVPFKSKPLHCFGKWVDLK